MTTLKQRIEAGQFIVTCELTPPKGTNLEPLFEKAESLRRYVDAFNLTESHAAKMAMDPTAVAHLLLDRSLQPIVQMTSRDKNRIAIQASMLGAAALGVENLVLMGGDPPTNGDHPEAKAVFDLFASQLLKATSALKAGTDYNGNTLNGSPKFCVGAVFNPGSTHRAVEIDNLHRKIEAGASFLQTQAVYDIYAFADFLNQTGDLGVPVLAGVIPVKSVKMAQYMNERVPGVNIPDALIRKIAQQGDDQDKVAATSLAISANIVRELCSVADGLHIMAIGWEDKIPAILEMAGVRCKTI